MQAKVSQYYLRLRTKASAEAGVTAIKGATTKATAAAESATTATEAAATTAAPALVRECSKPFAVLECPQQVLL